MKEQIIKEIVIMLSGIDATKLRFIAAFIRKYIGVTDSEGSQ